ncbi:hypothetical protein L1987_37831 [Smallanthus sonchifolius]|uniref:Uncharacterized protein n=1 Tax=Smallanthus sonchifolius TaxID=185202 RepID=A0ACB9HHU7_9ASTR|nr:hypothetical protein L1987_37831 [Smallanthus sonchifolius]
MDLPMDEGGLLNEDAEQIRHCLCAAAEWAGDATHAFAGKNDREHIEARIALMSCYQIHSYVCRATRAGMKTVRYNTTLKIGKATIIIPVDHSNVLPHFYFEFTPYTSLDNHANDNTLLTGKELLPHYFADRNIIGISHTKANVRPYFLKLSGYALPDSVNALHQTFN